MKELKSVTMASFEAIMRQRIRSKIREEYKYDVTVYFANDSQLFIEFLGATGSPIYKTQFDNIYAEILSGMTAQDIAKQATKRVRQYIVNQFFYLPPIDKSRNF